jgi:hypothetical protein
MTKISPSKLKSLKTSVYGSYEEIARAAEVSYKTVQSVLSGKWHNEKVLETAIRLRDRNEKKAKAKAERIKKIESKI